ncbi:MAG TPA: hypothetical protein V6D10_20860 [Trichocoleus sp.]
MPRLICELLQGIPGASNVPSAIVIPPKVMPTPDRQALGEILRLWQRTN